MLQLSTAEDKARYFAALSKVDLVSSAEATLTNVKKYGCIFGWLGTSPFYDYRHSVCMSLLPLSLAHT